MMGSLESATALPLSTIHPMRAADGLLLVGDQYGGRFFEDGVVGAKYFHGITGSLNPRFRYRPPRPRRSVDGSLLAGGRNDGGFSKRGGRFDILIWDRRSPETALPISTTPSMAGGRWLALGEWPRWRLEVFENGGGR